VVDHHVDRPGVEVRQRAKLTGTNHPIEFNKIVADPHTQQSSICILMRTKTNPDRDHRSYQQSKTLFPQPDRLDDLVALAGSLHPIPSRTRP
jgi:hypothetical protein